VAQSHAPWGGRGLTGIRGLTLKLLLAVGAVFAVCWWACGMQAKRIVDDAEVRGMEQMQVSADALAAQVRLLLGALHDIERLAVMTVQMSQQEVGETRRAWLPGMSLENLRDAIARSQIGIRSVQVFDRDGHVVLLQGLSLPADPDGQQLGFGLPWLGPDGETLLRWTASPADTSGLTLEITLDPEVLSKAIDRGFPKAQLVNRTMLGTVARMPDGVLLARTDMQGHRLEERIHLPPEVTARFLAQSTGGRRLISPLSHTDILAGVRTVPELGLVAIAVAGRDDMLGPARMEAAWWRAVPYAVLVAGLVSAAGYLVRTIWLREQETIEAMRRTAEATALARSEFESLAQHSPTFLYRGRVDAKGVFSLGYSTANTEPVTGWDRQALFDDDSQMSHLPEEDQVARAANFVLAVRQGRSAVEYRVEQPDGGYRWVRSDVAVVQRYPDGSADLVGTATNVTHEHDLATRMALVDRMTTLGEISISIAHELSQPVTVISMAASYAQMLAEEMTSADELRQQIEAILAQSQRAGEIIRHLRSYGHAEGGALGAVDLKQAVTSALELAGRPLAEARVVVEVDLPPDLPQVHGRQVQVEQVLLNLAINARDALRAMPKGERKLWISAEAAGGQIVVSVADNGPGIAPKVIGQVFDPFFTTKKVGEGTGLGLALCRSMMEGFGGAILVENVAPGVVFRLRFLRAVSEKVAA